MQNPHTTARDGGSADYEKSNYLSTAMDGRSRTSLYFATPGLLPNGGSVENVGTIFNHYIGLPWMEEMQKIV